MRNNQDMNEVGPSGRQGPCWNQITPQYMPWGHSPARPPAPLVTFTAQLASQQPTLENPQTLSLLCKRKASHLSMPTPSAKQLVTEERMAAHMSRLHISSETPAAVDRARAKESDATREQRLYVCEEMRRLQTESILPHALLGRVQRPCMAVMLWQPPPKIPESLLPATVTSNTPRPIVQPHENDNNNSCNVDLNNMDMDT